MLYIKGVFVNELITRAGRRPLLRATAGLAAPLLGGLPLVAGATPARAGSPADSLVDSLPVAPATLPASAMLAADRYAETYHQKWALSCEYAAVHTALRLIGQDVPEDLMRDTLGVDEDPDVAFRGRIQANQNLTDYGVHARGILHLVDLLKGAGALPARLQAQLLYDVDAIRAALAQGQPVVAWVPLDLRASYRVPVQLSSGKVVNLVPAEHALTLRGYSGDSLFALDPHAGAGVTYDAGAFARSMALFDDPALTLALAPAVPASEHFAETGITLSGGFYQQYRRLGGRDALGLPLTDEVYEADAETGADKMVVYTETARLEWYAETQSFGLGFVGQEFLADDAVPNPTRRLGGAIDRYVAAAGGLPRFGYSVSDEVPFTPGDPLLPPLPRGTRSVMGQWFQTALLVWSPATGVLLGRAGTGLAKRKGLF